MSKRTDLFKEIQDLLVWQAENVGEFAEKEYDGIRLEQPADEERSDLYHIRIDVTYLGTKIKGK